MDTTIRVDTRTRDALGKVGRKDETYEDVLLRLMAFWEEHPDLAAKWFEEYDKSKRIRGKQ